jgi:hypothetical protein
MSQTLLKTNLALSLQMGHNFHVPAGLSWEGLDPPSPLDFNKACARV